MLRINQNFEAMNMHRNLSESRDAMRKSFERLSSGLKINRNGDDAANSIAEKMRAETAQSIKQRTDSMQTPTDNAVKDVSNAKSITSSSPGQTGTVNAVMEVVDNSNNSIKNIASNEALGGINTIKGANISNGVARLTSNNILQQASVSTLAQANSPQNQVMQLLR